MPAVAGYDELTDQPQPPNPPPPPPLEKIIKYIVLLLIVAAALYVMLTPGFDEATQKWATGALGVAIGWAVHGP